MRKVFPVLVLLIFVAGLYSPETFTPYKSWIVPLLGVCMFGMGMALSVSDFAIVLKKPGIIAIGLAAQYVIMPGAAYLIARALSLPADIAIGVIMVGTCPGGVASNLMSYLARGDLALSVALTACSTIVSPVLTPVLMYLLADQWIDVDAVSIFYSIIQIVLLPVCAGMLLHRPIRRLSKKFETAMPIASMFAIVVIIGIIVALNADNIQKTAAITLVAVVLHNLAGMSFGYALGRFAGFTPAQRRTLSMEVGLQNSGLAASLCRQHFPTHPAAMLPAAFFSVWHNLSGSFMASIWSALAAKEEKSKLKSSEPASHVNQNTIEE